MTLTKQLRDRTLYHVRLHAPTVGRLVALLGERSPRFPKNSIAIDAACLEVVRIMEDPDVSVMRVSEFNDQLHSQRIKDARAIATSLGAKMWSEQTDTGLQIELRKGDKVIGLVCFPDRPFDLQGEGPTILPRCGLKIVA